MSSDSISSERVGGGSRLDGLQDDDDPCQPNLPFTSSVDIAYFVCLFLQQVSSLSGEEACRRLLALRSAAKAAPPPSPAPRPADVAPPPSPAPGPADGSSSPSANTKKHTKSNTNNIATPTAAPAATAAVIATNPVRQAWRERGAGALLAVTSRRRILTARHLVGHVVVLGFPSR